MLVKTSFVYSIFLLFLIYDEYDKTPSDFYSIFDIIYILCVILFPFEFEASFVSPVLPSLN